jgi:hypothetical protein
MVVSESLLDKLQKLYRAGDPAATIHFPISLDKVLKDTTLKL